MQGFHQGYPNTYNHSRDLTLPCMVCACSKRRLCRRPWLRARSASACFWISTSRLYPYLALPRLAIPFPTLSYLTSPYLSLPCLTLPHLTSPHLSLSCFCHNLLPALNCHSNCHVIALHVRSCAFATLCCVITLDPKLFSCICKAFQFVLNPQLLAPLIASSRLGL